MINLRKVKTYLILLFFSVISHPVFADLPKPPDKDIPNGTNDGSDAGGALIIKVLTIVCYVLAAGILISTAATIIKAFHVAQEKQDLGDIFLKL